MKLAHVACCLILVSMGALPGCTSEWNYANERATFELPLDASLVDGASSITIHTVAGDVLLERAEGEPRVVGKVRATTRERADTTAVHASRHENDLQISVHWPGDERENSEGCDLLVYVPVMDGVDIDTSSGDVFVKAMKGPLTIRSSSGDVEIRDHEGTILVRSSSGDIEAWDVSGTADVEASSGDIGLHGVSAPSRVKTSSGDIYVKFHKGVSTMIDAETSSGDIHVEGREYELDEVTHTIGAGGETSTLRTSSGDIDVVLSGE